MSPPNSTAGLGNHALRGAALGLALLEGVSLQARPTALDGLRLNALNTPEASGDNYQTGRGLLAVGDATGALAAFRQALLEAPQSVDALNGMAVAYDRLGRYDISRSYYDSALAIDPESLLVLNNLGYSLYLQGDLHAAIPVLQRAAASPDEAIGATSRRVLALVAESLRSAAVIADAAQARADIAQARADTAQPRARIELSADGEQRLVLGGPVPDQRLFARLGDAATLVTIAAPWGDRDERALERRELASDRAETAATEALAEAMAATAAIAHTAMAVDTPPLQPRLAAALVVEPPVAAIAANAAANSPAVLAPASALSDPANAPAWLLSSRRTARSGVATTEDHSSHNKAAALAFDSDDNDLNAFAARMRDGDADADANAAAAELAAVSRLEALLARVRRA